MGNLVWFAILSAGTQVSLWASVSPVQAQEKTELNQLAVAVQVKKCLHLLAAEQSVQRWVGARALSQLGPVAVSAVPNLIKAFADPAEDVRVEARDAVGKIGLGAVPALVRAIEDQAENVDARCLSIWVLGLFRSETAKNKSDMAAESSDAQIMIKRIEDVLLAALRDPNDKVVNSAVYAVAIREPRCSKAIPILFAALRDKSVSEQRGFITLHGLSFFGKQASHLKPELLAILTDRSIHVKVRACVPHTVAAIGEGDPDIVGVLKAILTDKADDGQVRARCAHALAEMQIDVSKELRECITETDKVATREQARLRAGAIEALGKMKKSDETLSALVRIASNTSESMGNRTSALKTIGAYKEHAVRCIGDLILIVQLEYNESAVKEAVIALGKIGPKAQRARLPLQLRADLAYTSGQLLAEIDKSLRLIGEK